ncbi:MAG: tetratricopeptide repeat protein [Cyclobacteriaceae bacterium]|nr:tetratricopeptide repeat protein [Cyclobacteriaceae bacterium]
MKTKSKIFLWLGIVLLFVFAIITNVDGALGWLIFGLALSCFVIHWMRTSSWINSAEEDDAPDIEDLLNQANVKRTQTETVKQQKSEEQKNRNAPTNKNDADQLGLVKKILSWIGYILIGLIFLLVLFGIFGSDEEADKLQSFSAEELVVKGDNSYTLTDYDSARIYYNLAKQKNENYPGSWLGIGNLKYTEGEKDSALWYYQKTVSIDARFSAGRFNIAWWHYNQGNYSEAISRLLSLTKDEPKNGQALQLLADIYYEKKDFNKAFDWYNKAYEADYANSWLCHVLGYLYDTRNQTKRAIELYKEAVYYNPNNAEVYVRLGELLPGNEGEPYRKKAAELKK